MADQPTAPAGRGQAGCTPICAAPLSDESARCLARQFAALADPVRLRMLSALASAPGGAVCACDLVEPAGKSQPTVSHHLRVLKGAGLVTTRREGAHIWYAVEPAALGSFRGAVGARGGYRGARFAR